MVAINFQERFAEAVECGGKLQTIRKVARCKPGDQLQLYTGMRTKSCRKLAEGICTRVRAVKITFEGMWLDGQIVFAGSARRGDLVDFDDDFARKDGFESFIDMADWFRAEYGQLPFEGHVIEWRLA